jgi:hypothetical protein
MTFVRCGDNGSDCAFAVKPSSPAPSARRKRRWGLTAQRRRARALSMP